MCNAVVPEQATAFVEVRCTATVAYGTKEAKRHVRNV